MSLVKNMKEMSKERVPMSVDKFLAQFLYNRKWSKNLLLFKNGTEAMRFRFHFVESASLFN